MHKFIPIYFWGKNAIFIFRSGVIGCSRKNAVQGGFKIDFTADLNSGLYDLFGVGLPVMEY